MSRLEDIDTSIWTDEDFVDHLSPEAKLLYIWAFTNSHNNMAGLYRITRSSMMAETTLSLDRLNAALDELAEWRFAFFEGGVMWVRTRVKRLRQRTPNMATSIRRALASVAENPLVERFREEYGGDKWVTGAVLQEPMDDPSTTLDQGIAKTSSSHEEGSCRASTSLQGKGKGKGLKKTTKENSDLDARAFDEWLLDHSSVTGMIPPKVGTKARAAVRDAFLARLAEGYSIAELKSATRGAQADEHRRTNGYVGPDSVLRPTKIHGLIENGRRAKPASGRASDLVDLLPGNREDAAA